MRRLSRQGMINMQTPCKLILMGCPLLLAVSLLASDIVGQWVAFEFSEYDASRGKMIYDFQPSRTVTISYEGFGLDATYRINGTYVFKTNALTLVMDEKGTEHFIVQFLGSTTIKLTDSGCSNNWVKCRRTSGRGR